MNVKIINDDAIFGLIWCIAASDSNKWGFLEGDIISEKEINFLQNIIIKENLNLSKKIKLHENNELNFYGLKGLENIHSIWESCSNKLINSEKIIKIKVISLMFTISYVENEKTEIFNNYLSGSKKELSLIYKTLEKFKICKNDLSKIIKGEDPEIICSLSGKEFLNSLVAIKGIERDIAISILKDFENSYELSNASIKKLLGIPNLTIENATNLLNHFGKK